MAAAEYAAATTDHSATFSCSPSDGRSGSARLCAEADKRQAEEALVHERAARLVTEQLFAKEPAAP